MHLSVFVSILVVSTAASPSSSNYVLHEKRGETTSKSWTKRMAVDPKMSLPMRIGLKQGNLHKGDDLLMDVSHPDSPNYGKYYTAEQVNDLFAPAEETVRIVLEWLEASGVSGHRISQSANKAWLQFDANTEEAEGLLKTKYHIFEHTETGSKKVACDEYHLPSHVRDHVDYVTPGIKLLLGPNNSKESFTGGASKRSSLSKRDLPFPLNELQGLDHCDTVMTPTCVSALYNITKADKARPDNRLGIYEFADQYNQIDMDRWFRDFAPEIPNGTAPEVRGVDGGVAPGPQGRGFESFLDLQIAYPLLYPQGTVIYQVEDEVYANGDFGRKGLFNNFLDAIDGSYCAYAAYGETGNNPEYDYSYPNPAPGGYKGELQCGVYEPTNVLSISYAWAEDYFPMSYQRRQCDEWMKLGLQGVSVVFASGDYGVGGSFGWSDRPNLCLGNGSIFNPAWPSTCPYVTSTGSTYLPPGADVRRDEEVAAVAIGFRSGGGFSNIYPTPDYQKAAVDKYFEVADPIVQAYPYYSSVYNDSFGAGGGIYNRAGRAYPDVSSVGTNFVLYGNNQTSYPNGGTSVSAPIFASILTRINEERLAVGKSTVGFVNPVLYAHPEVLHDITAGNNSGCGSAGFIASEGWDPVTGLGTPNYPTMLNLWMSLP